MEQLLIRNLPNGTKNIIKQRSVLNNRSIEAEARDIIVSAIQRSAPSIVDLLAMPESAEIEFEPERLNITARIPEL